METTKIPLSSCIESKHQNRIGLGDVTGLARSIKMNGQITPLIVVADGDGYQLVAGHRRTAAMKSLGLEEADAYVMDGWDDARIAQILNAENNHRKELSEDERVLMEHLHGLLAGNDEDEEFDEVETTEAIEDAAEVSNDEPPFDTDAIDGKLLDGHQAIAVAA